MSPSHSDVPHGDCLAAREVLSRVGDKWSVFIIALLGDGTKRFSEIKRTIEGISQRMLTLTLRALERDGLVMRTVFPTIPPRVDYALTPLGATLLEPVRALAAWAQLHRQEIQDARDRFDAQPMAVLPASPTPPAISSRATRPTR
jgi:DNA-binding HxlR family transcriptional regulator